MEEKERLKIQNDIIGLIAVMPQNRIKWKYQYPPERRGAVIALLHVLGMSWESANKFSFNGNNGNIEYLKLFKKLARSPPRTKDTGFPSEVV